MVNAGNRLRRFMRDAGVTQVSLSDAIGISQSQVSAWCSGENKISNTAAFLIREIYHLNPDWLLFGDGEMFVHPPSDAARADSGGETIDLRFYHNGVPASPPGLAVEEYDMVRVIRRRGYHKNVILVPVKGNSMRDAGILPRDVVACDTTRRAKNNDIVIARLDGEVTIKQIRIKGTGANRRVLLMPHGDMRSPIKPNGELEIVGVVIRLERDYLPDDDLPRLKHERGK